MLSDGQRIGIGLCLLGLSLGSIGVVCMLDRSLLTLGNIAFMTGLGLVLGCRKTVHFFLLKPSKWKASILYLIGFILIACNYSLIGLPLQIYGLFNLFYSFIPHVLSAIRLSPVGSYFFQLPFVKPITKRILDSQKQLPL